MTEPKKRKPPSGICKHCGMAYKYFLQHRKNECTNPQPLNNKKKRDARGLTVREKQVMEIKENLGLDGKYPSNAEVAQALGMTSSNVSSMLTNARKKLTGLPPDLLDGRKNKTVNATTLDVLDAIQKKSVNELQRRVANKQNLKNMPIEELLALIKGAGSAMAQEVNLNNAGAGDDKIVFEGDENIFKVAGGAVEPTEDATQEDREDQPTPA